jgi:Ca-activated chloride channel family protein
MNSKTFLINQKPSFSLRLHAVLALAVCILLLAISPKAQALPYSAQGHTGESLDQEVKQLVQHSEVWIHNQVAASTHRFQFQSNHGADLEISCWVELGQTELVDGFSYWNGTEQIVGEVLEKQAANQVYQQLTGMQRDPGILEQVGSKFRFRVYPVQPKEVKPVELKTTAVLERREGVLEYTIPLANLPGPDVAFSLSIHLTDDLPIEEIETQGFHTSVREASDGSKTLHFESTGVTFTQDLTLRYRVGAPDYSLRFMAHREAGSDGSFMILVSPKKEVEKSDVIGRDLVFVVDISGSMQGEALEQTKTALATVLERLNPDDRFDVLAFDDQPIPFFGALRGADRKNKGEAIKWVQALESRGGTQIKTALLKALDELETAKTAARRGGGRPQAIIFLTDGQGSEPPEVVLSEFKQRSSHVRLYSFGAGSGVNRGFLTRLARDNRGIATFIQNRAQIENSVLRLYNKISTPLMVDLELEIEGAETYSLYPNQLSDLYEDGEVVVLGRYRNSGPAKIKVRGMLAGQKKELTLDIDLPKADKRFSYVEKLWAFDRVEHLLSMHRTRGDKEIEKEITRLGIVYNLVTPFTTFLAVPASLQTKEIKEAMRAGRRGYDRRLIDSVEGIRLSQQDIPPGDPVLTVFAPEDAKRVVAYFPFGLVKRMDYDEIRERWAARFLVPRWVPDGVYTIRVMIVHESGRREWRNIQYRIDGTEPEFDALLPEFSAPGERLHIEVDPFEPVRRVYAYLPGIDDTRIEFELDMNSGIYVADIRLPAEIVPDEVTVRIVVRDRARNRHQQDFRVVLVEASDEGCALPPKVDSSLRFAHEDAYPHTAPHVMRPPPLRFPESVLRSLELGMRLGGKRLS